VLIDNGVTTAEFTVTETSEVLDSAPSLAVRRSVYVPGNVNEAVVLRELLFTNATVPGPLTLLQATLRVLPPGKPSSLAVPERVAALGYVIVWLVPAFTMGAVFVVVTTGVGLLTVMTTSEVEVSAVSLAVRRKL
jgi:hypothetical protein